MILAENAGNLNYFASFKWNVKNYYPVCAELVFPENEKTFYAGLAG